MKKLLQEYIKLQISKILSEGFYENPMTTIQDVLDSFSGRTLIFFDTETTGFSGTMKWSQITEIAAVAFDDQANQLEKYHTKIELSPAVEKEIKKQKERQKDQQFIDSLKQELPKNIFELKKLEEILENLAMLIQENFKNRRDLIKLQKELLSKLSSKIEEVSGIQNNLSLKNKDFNFSIKEEIQKILSLSEKATEEEQIDALLKNNIQKFIETITQEKAWEAGRQSIEDILKLTGYHNSDDPTVQYIEEKEALEGFKQFIDSFPKPLLIAHNATFDMMQINNGMKRHNLGYLSKYQVLDTVKLVENYIKPLLRILKGGNPTEKTKRLIVALSFQTKDIKEMDIEQYKAFIDKQNIEDIYKNVNKLYGSLKHLTAGLNVELKNWHSAVADAEALSGVMLNLSQIMFKYKHFEQQFELQRKRAAEIGFQRQRAKKKKQS